MFNNDIEETKTLGVGILKKDCREDALRYHYGGALGFVYPPAMEKIYNQLEQDPIASSFQNYMDFILHSITYNDTESELVEKIKGELKKLLLQEREDYCEEEDC